MGDFRAKIETYSFLGAPQLANRGYKLFTNKYRYFQSINLRFSQKLSPHLLQISKLAIQCCQFFRKEDGALYIASIRICFVFNVVVPYPILESG